MIKIKTWGHESTSVDRKPMNVKYIQAADALRGSACWLSLCLARSYYAGSYFSLSTILKTCLLWSSYLLGHQRFPLNRASLAPLPLFFSRIVDVSAFVTENVTSSSQIWPFGDSSKILPVETMEPINFKKCWPGIKNQHGILGTNGPILTHGQRNPNVNIRSFRWNKTDSITWWLNVKQLSKYKQLQLRALRHSRNDARRALSFSAPLQAHSE